MDTPNTVNYMLAGYLVFSAIFVIYVASLFLRWRNMQRDLQLLEEMAPKDNA
jgi:hypothetical protein